MAGSSKDSLMNLAINIERLVLDGIIIPYHRQPLLQGAVELEMQRLFTNSDLSSEKHTSKAVSYISGDPIILAGDFETNPTFLGKQIARVVYERIKQ